VFFLKEIDVITILFHAMSQVKPFLWKAHSRLASTPTKDYSAM
jgi:hypothetical protein